MFSTMYVMILYLVMCISSATSVEQFLSHLYGVEKRNYMQICLKATAGRRERTCPGALLSDAWVGVSAGCLRTHPQEKMIALRQTEGERCKDVIHGYSTRNTRNVWAHFYHPWLDLTLMFLDRPYMTPLDVHPNSTAWTVQRVFRKYGQWRWMKQYMKAYALAYDPRHHMKQVAEGLVSVHSPLLVTFLAIVLPSLVYALVFIYVIFYSNPKKAPCKRLHYNKKKKCK